MSNSPEPRNSLLNPLNRLLQAARHPTAIAFGITSVTLVIVGSVGFRFFMTQTLPNWLEKTLSDALNREVRLGEVESYSLTNLKMGVSSIPETPIYQDKITIQTIDAQFNPLFVLWQRRLPIKVILKNIDGYLKQDSQGNWPIQSIDKIKLPVDLDLSFEIQDADITLKPTAKVKPLTVEIEGKGRYIELPQQKTVQYNLIVVSLNNQINIKGNTVLPTGKSQVELIVQKLALEEIASLVANLPITVNQGQLNANINAQIDSFNDIQNSQGKGNVNINNLTVNNNNLKTPIKVNANFILQDTKLIFEKLQLNWREMQANVQGSLDWKKGWDLVINVKPFDISKLIKDISISLPFSINGNLQTQFNVKGTLFNPLVTGILKNNQVLFVDRIILKEFNTTFQANLNQFTIKTLKIRPAVGGEIEGKGTIQTQWKKYINQPKTFDWAKLPLKFTVNAQLPTQDIIDIYYKIPSSTQIGNLQAKGQITGTLKNPQASIKWQLPNTNLPSINNIYGKGELVVFNKNILLRNSEFQTDKGKITLAGKGNLNTNLWQTDVQADSFNLTPSIALDRGNIKLLGTFKNLNFKNITGIADLLLKIDGATVVLSSQLQKGNINGSATAFRLTLNRFLPNLPVSVKVSQSQANFSGSITQLLTKNRDKFNSLNTTANLELLLDNRPVFVQTTLNSGILKTDITTNQIALSPFIPNLNIPVNLTRSKVNLSGQITSLLSLLNLYGEQENNSYQDIKLTADTQFNIANNIIDAKTQLNNNQWQTQILASNLSNTSFCLPVVTSCPAINAQINLVGNLDSLIQKNSTIPIQAKTITLQVEGQNLKANGNIILENITTTPDANVNLNVEYSSNLKSLLPLDEFISQIPIQRGLLLTQSSVTGQTYFKGRLMGENLLTATNPLEKIQLAGTGELTNLSINNRNFEPRMTGLINVSVQQQITVNLRGKKDIFAFTLERCSQNSCLVPFLPKSFQVLQSYNVQIPAQLKGNRQGELLIADLQNFPLELLRITPIKTLGIPANVTGNVDADLQVNLFTLTGIANLNIQQPGIGNIQAESFETELVYNNGLAQLKAANLQIGKTRYEIDGNFDVNTQALRGRLLINQGNIQDLIQETNLATLLNSSQEQPSQTATASQLQPYSIGDANAPISEQLNQFRENQRKISQQADRIESGLVAPILDLQGKFQAEVNLAGTLQNPQINLQFEGQQWQWFPKPQYLNLVEPVGLVIQEAQTIPIDQISLQGQLENGQIKLNYQSQVGTAAIAFNANLIQHNQKWSFQESTFGVQNLSLDLLRYFFKPPIDIGGEINAQGIIQGNPLNPKITSNFAFIDGTLNGRPLNIPVEGNVRYANQRLTLNTLDSPIKIYASVPYPIESKRNDRIELNLKLTTEVLALIDLLTQGQLSWVGGEGEVNLNAKGRIALAEEFKIYDLNSNGQITLNNATLQTPNLDRSLSFNGQLVFNNQYLEAKQLQGNLLGTEVNITGILPLFAPLTSNQNPFTITFLNGQLESKDRYRGEVSSNVIITGSAISPILGGEIRVSNGQIILNDFQQEKSIVSPIYQQWAGTNNLKPTLIQPPKLDNFLVVVDNIELIQNQRLPQYKFQVSGQLNLQGNLTNLASLKPSGKINVDEGKVYILTTDVFLSSQYENTLTFLPDEGLFNPYLDIQLKTFLWDTAIVANTNNEIPDDIVKTGRQRSVEIALTIQGEAQQLFSATETVEKACQFQEEQETLRLINPTVVPELSQQLTDCLRVAAFANTESDLQLLRSPVITISSSPPLTQNELTVLFNRELAEASQFLQEQNTAQLVEIGIPQIAATLVPFLQQEIFEINEWTTRWAKSTFDLESLQIFPAVQTGYQLKDGTRVRISYDYLLDEVTVRYETRW